MKQIVFLYSLLVAGAPCFCQTNTLLEEGKSNTVNGVELGFRVSNETTKTSGKEEFGRFKIVVFAKNVGCKRIILNKDNNQFEDDYSGRERNLLATFFFKNANGKRLTSKKGNLLAKEWWIPIKQQEKGTDGKEVTITRRQMAGFIFNTNERLEKEYIILIPLGERPVVEAELMEEINY